MRLGEVFAGIGGLGLGLSWGLGHAETLWQVEYEEHARLILAQHWPEAERHKDVRDVGSRNLAPVDLICGGWPCQPHSTAGKRQSSNDDRDLWHEFARVVSEVKPRWVVGENVPGLLSSADPAFSRDHAGGFFGRVLRDLAEMGFDAEWACFPAAAVGAHHLRNRVFLIAWNMDNAERLGRDTGRHDYGEHDWNLTGATGQDAGALAHTPQLRRRTRPVKAIGEHRETGGLGPGESSGACAGASDVAYPLRSGRQEQHAAALTAGTRHDTGGGHALRNPAGEGLPDWAGGTLGQPSPVTEFERPSGREIERDFCGMAHGVSLRVDRLTRLGNGVVPQQAAVIGRAVKDAQAHWERWGVMPERLIRPEHFRAGA